MRELNSHNKRFAQVIMILLWGATPVVSADALRLELDELAKDIKAVVDKQGGGSIAVGGFGEPADALGSSSVSIQLQLRKALEAKLMTVVADNFAFQVSGTYQGKVNEGLLGVRVNTLLSDNSGTILKVFARDIFGAEAVTRTLGISTRNNPNAPKAEQHVDFARKKSNPDVHIDGTQIRTTAGSPYAIEILVKQPADDGTVPILGGEQQYQVRTPTTENDAKGRPFVPIKKGEVYAVRLINDSPHEAAVNLSIDGINCFEFSEVDSTFWIVSANSSMLVKGWHKSKTTTREFKVTQLPDTATTQLNLKPSTAIGTITAAFSAAWTGPDDQPPNERSRGTGFGDEIQFQTIKVKRQIGNLRDNIVVRYERNESPQDLPE